jgi:hypothetical protein
LTYQRTLERSWLRPRWRGPGFGRDRDRRGKTEDRSPGTSHHQKRADPARRLRPARGTARDDRELRVTRPASAGRADRDPRSPDQDASPPSPGRGGVGSGAPATRTGRGSAPASFGRRGRAGGRRQRGHDTHEAPHAGAPGAGSSGRAAARWSPPDASVGPRSARWSGGRAGRCAAGTGLVHVTSTSVRACRTHPVRRVGRVGRQPRCRPRASDRRVEGARSGRQADGCASGPVPPSGPLRGVSARPHRQPRSLGTTRGDAPEWGSPGEPRAAPRRPRRGDATDSPAEQGLEVEPLQGGERRGGTRSR